MFYVNTSFKKLVIGLLMKKNIRMYYEEAINFIYRPFDYKYYIFSVIIYHRLQRVQYKINEKHFSIDNLGLHNI